VHFSHLHHPILGDSLYGGNRPGVPYQAGRQLLHAWKLAFPHPRTKVMREYMAPLPEDFAAALAALGLPAIATHHDADPPIQPQDLPEDPES
jgi:23S rRNA pseudouridine1911/1915/1917 synthase